MTTNQHRTTLAQPERPMEDSMNHGQQRATLTVTQAAAVLGISRALAFECVRTGRLPAVKMGRRILVPRVALERLLDVGGPRLDDGQRS